MALRPRPFMMIVSISPPAVTPPAVTPLFVATAAAVADGLTGDFDLPVLRETYPWAGGVCLVRQIGTVKEGPAEYFSSRMTNKERKKTLVDELLVADDAFRYRTKNHPPAFLSLPDPFFFFCLAPRGIYPSTVSSKR